jgi:hypothetical protein
MPDDRIGELCDSTLATLDRCIRKLRWCVWVMWFNLALTLIIFVKVFFYA